MRKVLGSRSAVGFIHVTAAVAAPASFWLFARGDFVRIDLFSLTYGLLPLSGVTLAIAATRPQFWTGFTGEVSVAILWLVAFVSFSTVDALYRRYGQVGVDASAALTGIGAGAMLFLGFRLFTSGHSRDTALPARLVYGAGVAVLAVTSLRIARQLYLNTRMLESPGLEGVFAEVRLRLWLAVVAVVALIGGALLRRRLREAHKASVA